MDQDFALVSSGNLVRPGTGFILLDRPTYTAPGIMQIAVFDAARAGKQHRERAGDEPHRAYSRTPASCMRWEITARSPARSPP